MFKQRCVERQLSSVHICIEPDQLGQLRIVCLKMELYYKHGRRPNSLRADDVSVTDGFTHFPCFTHLRCGVDAMTIFHFQLGASFQCDYSDDNCSFGR